MSMLGACYTGCITIIVPRTERTATPQDRRKGTIPQRLPRRLYSLQSDHSSQTPPIGDVSSRRKTGISDLVTSCIIQDPCCLFLTQRQSWLHEKAAGWQDVGLVFTGREGLAACRGKESLTRRRICMDWIIPQSGQCHVRT